MNRSYDSDAEFDPNYDKTHWQRFAHHIRSLNQSITDTSSVYKVFFIGRHGEGIHNVAEAYYGTKAWDVSPSSFCHHARMIHWRSLYSDALGRITGPFSPATTVSHGRMLIQHTSAKSKLDVLTPYGPSSLKTVFHIPRRSMSVRSIDVFRPRRLPSRDCSTQRGRKSRSALW